MLVQRKDETWTLHIEYRSLNKIIVKNWYPIPQIDDPLDQLKDAKFFSKIDMNSSYHQVPIKKIDVWKIIFQSK